MFSEPSEDPEDFQGYFVPGILCRFFGMSGCRLLHLATSLRPEADVASRALKVSGQAQ